jgi:MoaA/NifB/PqqE/SkfB family radical SAM enzyme
MGITERIDAVTEIGSLRIRMGKIQPAPKSVKIELTSRCNLKCKFCAVRTRRQKVSDMDFWLFQKITEDMRISGVEEIGLFFLGESFMNPDLLIKSVKWCKDLGFPYLFLTSNATMAKSTDVMKVMEAGLDSLKWSINSYDAKQFNQITGGNEETFERAFINIKRAFDGRNLNNHSTALYASSILYEGEQREKMQALLDEKVIPFVDQHYWLPLYQMSMYREKMEKDLGFIPTAGNMGRLDSETLEPLRPSLPCWTAFTEAHVRVDGGLSACCFGADDRFDMGLLDGTNFMRQWNTPKFNALRESQLKTLTEGQNALKGTPCEVCVAYEDKKEATNDKQVTVSNPEIEKQPYVIGQGGTYDSDKS